jgi:hypothetical protein
MPRTDGMDPRPLICGLAMGQRCAEQHPNKRGGSEMEVTTIGIDLAKSAFAVSGADSSSRLLGSRSTSALKRSFEATRQEPPAP